MTTLLEKVRKLATVLDEPGARVKLYTGEDLKKMPPPTWLVEGYIPKGGMAVLYGPSGSGKSFITLDWALSIATGREWFGHAVAKGPVVYVAGEGKGGLAKRLVAWETDRRFFVMNNLYFITVPVQLMVRDEVLAFVELMEMLPEKPALVIFDTMARCMVGGDENSARDVGQFVAGADLVRDLVQTAVLIVHHTTKGSNVERGSGALRGAADAMIGLTPEDDTMLLMVDKQKDGTPAEPISLRLVPVLKSESCVVGKGDYTTSGSGLTKDQRRVLKALSIMPDGASRKDWQEMADMKLGPFMVVVKALVDKGLVQEPDEKPKRYRVKLEGYQALG